MEHLGKSRGRLQSASSKILYNSFVNLLDMKNIVAAYLCWVCLKWPHWYVRVGLYAQCFSCHKKSWRGHKFYRILRYFSLLTPMSFWLLMWRVRNAGGCPSTPNNWNTEYASIKLNTLRAYFASSLSKLLDLDWSVHLIVIYALELLLIMP